MAIVRATPRYTHYVTITSAATSADANDANDVIFDKTLIPLTGMPGWSPGRPVILNDIIYLDPAAQAVAALTWWFFDTAITTFGAADAAPTISDGDAATTIARVAMATTDQTVTTNNTIGAKHGINAVVATKIGLTGIYVALQSGGTPNHAGATLTCRFGFII